MGKAKSAPKRTPSAVAKPTATSRAKSTKPVSEFYQPRKRRPFSVFLIVDEADVRKSLADILKSESLDVHEYMTAMEFYRDYRTPVPGVVICEVRLRGMSGIELHDKLVAEKCELPIVLIAGHADAPTAIRAVRGGAFDFLTKPISPNSLVSVVASAYCCYYDVDADVLMIDPDEAESGLRRLTDREREVLEAVCEGLSSRDISARLGISTKTVEAHRARINDKMRSDDLSHLVRMVMALQE